MKMFYTIGEVAEMMDVSTSLLRFWETKFPQLKPSKTSKGQRTYSLKDIDLIKRIYHLTKECGYTLDGALMQIKNRHSPATDVAAATTAHEETSTGIQTIATPANNTTVSNERNASEDPSNPDALQQPCDTTTDEKTNQLYQRQEIAITSLKNIRQELAQLKTMLHDQQM